MHFTARSGGSKFFGVFRTCQEQMWWVLFCPKIPPKFRLGPSNLTPQPCTSGEEKIPRELYWGGVYVGGHTSPLFLFLLFLGAFSSSAPSPFSLSRESALRFFDFFFFFFRFFFFFFPCASSFFCSSGSAKLLANLKGQRQTLLRPDTRKPTQN